MSCPEQIVQLMHKHLDGDILPEDENVLKQHLQSCGNCKRHFHEMEKSVALVRSTSHVTAPADFTAKVMANLPKEKKRASVKRWIKTHPMIAAAAVFVILMGGGFFNSWHNDHNFSVSKQPNLVVQNHTKEMVLEILTGMKRAGADLIMTYHAKDAARWLAE